MSRGGYRRIKPKISFFLATCFLIVLALILTGILFVSIDLSPFETNPRAVIIAVVFAGLAALLLFEW